MTLRGIRSFVLFSAAWPFLCSSHHVQAQIITLDHDSDGEWYSCAVSGLKGMGSDCGVQYDDMVFTATIASVHPAADGELRLTLEPETVFKGEPAIGMEIMTAQHKCLPPIKTGDHWLFSLYRDHESKELRVNYGSRSGPIDEMSATLTLLRRLTRLSDSGVVKGHVYVERDVSENEIADVPLANLSIIVTQEGTGRESQVVTDKDGNFEFEPLAAGDYDLNPLTKRGLWTMWSGKFSVKPHGCTDFDLDMHVDGQISGKVVFPAGIDPYQWSVKVSPVDQPGITPDSEWTDRSGGFVLHGLKPGRYVVAVEATEHRDGPNLALDLFAPGTGDRTNAREIELGEASHVDGVEITVPSTAIQQ